MDSVTSTEKIRIEYISIFRPTYGGLFFPVVSAGQLAPWNDTAHVSRLTITAPKVVVAGHSGLCGLLPASPKKDPPPSPILSRKDWGYRDRLLPNTGNRNGGNARPASLGFLEGGRARIY